MESTFLNLLALSNLRRFAALALLLGVALPGPVMAQGPAANPTTHLALVPGGSRWKYRDTGVDPGAAWKDAGFDDRGWSQGRGRFGYGGDGELTVLGYGADANAKFITSWFRHSFYVENPAQFSGLTLKMTRDDGAVAYVNGVEVVRSNMPAGTIAASTLASSATPDEYTYLSFALNPSVLVAGRNVIAVEVHQVSGTSSDLGFDAELVATTSAPLCDSPLRFAVIGDYGINSAEEGWVSSMVAGWNPSFIVTTGDNNYPNGEASTIDLHIGKFYHPFIYNYKGTYGPGADRRRFYPTLGNHDWDNPPAPNCDPYLAYFDLPLNEFGHERFYDVVEGPVHLFALSSDTREPRGTTPESEQGQWFQRRIATSTAPWRLVVFHHPPYSSSSNHGNNSWMQWNFPSWGVEVVLGGHDHDYERVQRNGISYIVNGFGGAPRYSFAAVPQGGSVVRSEFTVGAQLCHACDSYLVMDAYTTTDGSTGQLVDRTAIYRPRPAVAVDGRVVAGMQPVGATGKRLFAKRVGDWLYLAADLSNSNDQFIYVARAPGAMIAANWSKAGQVAKYDFFLAREQGNGFNAWFDQNDLILDYRPGLFAAAGPVPDGQLTGAIHLPTVYGAVPEKIYVALASFLTADSGTLFTPQQVPAPVVDDGNVQANEFLELDLRQVTSGWVAR